jgi:diacylglycerol kinase (ATP)
MTAKVIFNPYSNRWNAQKRMQEAESALRAAGISYELVISEHAGHIPDLAEKAAWDGFSPIIVAGGDGSIGEVVNGLARVVSDDEPLPALGILPIGTANDLAFSLKLPLDLTEAARVIAAGKVRRMDLGKVNGRYFVNNAGLGLEPTITVIQEQIGWIKGIMRYLVAAVRGIMDAPRWHAKMEWDGGSFDGPISLISICNSARSGGVFFMAPHANLFDGKLTVVYGFRSGRMEMMALLPKAMKPGAGNYVESPGVVEMHTTWLKVQLDVPSPAHTDGELFSRSIQNLEYRILPAKVQVILP